MSFNCQHNKNCTLQILNIILYVHEPLIFIMETKQCIYIVVNHVYSKTVRMWYGEIVASHHDNVKVFIGVILYR